jgi:hypothetical protein
MVFWFGLILSAAQAAGAASDAKSNVDAANRAQRQYEKLNLQFTNADLIAGYAAVSARRLQERSVITDSIEMVSADASRRIGAVSVSGGESGVHGKTSAALIDDFRRVQLTTEQNLLDTERYSQEQYGRDVEAMRSQAYARLLQGQQQRIPEPNYAGIFLNAAGNYMQMANSWNAANPVNNGDVQQGDPRGRS